MNIEITRSGGFAGGTEPIASIDTVGEPNAAREVERVIREMKFFDLPTESPTGAVGADLFHYTIRVTDAGRTHTVRYTDDGQPNPLRHLLDLVGAP